MGEELAVEHLTVERAGRTVVRDVSFTLAPGDIVTVVGPNGAGKSSLLEATLGLLPPVSGSVIFGGTPLRDLGTRARVFSHARRGGATTRGPRGDARRTCGTLRSAVVEARGRPHRAARREAAPRSTGRQPVAGAEATRPALHDTLHVETSGGARRAIRRLRSAAAPGR